MYIYNTTFLVSHNRYNEWHNWLKEHHIPHMLQHNFTKPQIAKVLSAEADQDGTSISVQFHVESGEIIEKWEMNHAHEFHQQMTLKFGHEVLFFPTILELL